jgi:hypothetical protein
VTLPIVKVEKDGKNYGFENPGFEVLRKLIGN